MLIAIITAIAIGLAAFIGAQSIETEVENLRQKYSSDPLPTTELKTEVDDKESEVHQEVRFRVKENLHAASESAEVKLDQRLDRAQERTEGQFNDAIDRVREKRQSLPEEFQLDLNHAEQELRDAEQEVLDAIEQMRH